MTPSQKSLKKIAKNPHKTLKKVSKTKKIEKNPQKSLKKTYPNLQNGTDKLISYVNP
jgi:hypothetical protein